ncbi:MAG: hypothetical protein PVJ27_08090 [Candidatus Brocadiaceae bacterium]
MAGSLADVSLADGKCERGCVEYHMFYFRSQGGQSEYRVQVFGTDDDPQIQAYPYAWAVQVGGTYGPDSGEVYFEWRSEGSHECQGQAVFGPIKATGYGGKVLSWGYMAAAKCED